MIAFFINISTCKSEITPGLSAYTGVLYWPGHEDGLWGGGQLTSMHIMVLPPAAHTGTKHKTSYNQLRVLYSGSGLRHTITQLFSSETQITKRRNV